jgi:NTP pyrophosphatase (non-canonical NTP hydrolase)
MEFTTMRHLTTELKTLANELHKRIRAFDALAELHAEDGEFASEEKCRKELEMLSKQLATIIFP